MSYGINPEAVERLREAWPAEMAELEAGRPCKWACLSDPLITQRLAWRIRNALRIASRYPNRFPALAQAAKNFSIHVVRDGLIEARWKPGATQTEAELGSTPTHGGMDEPHGKAQPSISLSRADEVIEAWQRHLPSSDPLHFTSTLLGHTEMVALYTWAVHNTPRLMLLVDEDRHTLTVSLHDTSAVEFAWHPPKAAPLPEKFDL
jgi:hypothetical protein